MKRDYWIYGGMGVVALVGIWVLFVGLPRWYPSERVPTPTNVASGKTTDNEFVAATLFYISDDGMGLVGFERRLVQHADPAVQGRIILEAQLAEPPASLLSPIPPGTELRAFYLSDQDAFVDLSAEVTLGHSGGSLEELFTVYAIVNAVTTNISTINAVQILVDGKEVDTLVGHVDLQHPLELNMQWAADPDTDATQSSPVDQTDQL